MRILFIVYDNASYISSFPIGIAMLTAVLENAGHHVDIYQQDINHWPAAHLAAYLAEHEYDLVGLSFIGGYWQYRKAIEIAGVVNADARRRKTGKPYFVLGGHGPAPEPEFFLKKLGADIVCIGEGEKTILELCDALESSVPALGAIQGIAWRSGDDVTINERRPLIKNIDSLPFPAYHRFPVEIYRLARFPHVSHTDFVMEMLSGRGCTFRCNFCYRMDKGFRPRSNEAIIDEIRFLKRRYDISYIAFFDELLMSSVERTASLCEDMLRSNLDIRWECNGRLNYATPDLLQLMRRAGCVFINYGIESFDDRILRVMHKGLTTGQIERGIQATLASGISPGLNIIFGNIGENRETLQKGVDFLLKYDDGAQLRTIRPVTPYPGCELYHIAIERGLIRDCEDFYENKHTNSDLMAVNFTQLSDDEFYEALYEANAALLENYRRRSAQIAEQTLDRLYRKRDASFRGFRHA